MTVDSHDRVIVVGTSVQGGTSYDFAVARLTADGVLDTSFSGDGKHTFDFGNNQNDEAYGVAVDSQDRVLLAGYFQQGATYYDFAVARLTTGGVLERASTATACRRSTSDTTGQTSRVVWRWTARTEWWWAATRTKTARTGTSRCASDQHGGAGQQL